MLNKKSAILIGILISFLSTLNLSLFKFLPSFFTQKVLAENVSFTSKNGDLNQSTKNKQLGNKVGKFVPTYQPTNQTSTYKFRLNKNETIKTNPIEHNAIKQILEKSFNQVIYQLNNSGLVMRRDIPVVFRDCGTPNAYWNSRDKIIIICYENMAYDLALFEVIGQYSPQEALRKSVNETIFAFYHELGHALIDVLPLAAVGQEEDTVDEFAAITLLKHNNPQNAQIVLDGAEFYRLKNGQPLWWDEHTPDLKRVFNIVCFVYGSNPNRYKREFEQTLSFVNAQGYRIPQEKINRRASLCKRDYKEKVVKWDKLMIPHYAQQNSNDSNTRSNNNSSEPAVNGGSRRGTFW